MTPNEYQNLAARTEASQDNACRRLLGKPTLGAGETLANNFTDLRAVRLLHGLVGLSNEAGELTSLVQKRYWYGKDVPDAEFRTKVKDEAGDLCWHLMQVLSSQGLTFQEVLEANILKLKTRYPDAGWDADRCADENRDRARELAAVGAGRVQSPALARARELAAIGAGNGRPPLADKFVAWVHARYNNESADATLFGLCLYAQTAEGLPCREPEYRGRPLDLEAAAELIVDHEGK